MSGTLFPQKPASTFKQAAMSLLTCNSHSISAHVVVLRSSAAALTVDGALPEKHVIKGF